MYEYIISNRIIATTIVVAVLVVFRLLDPSFRVVLRIELNTIIQELKKPKIIVVFLTYIAWACICIVGFAFIGFFDITQAIPTIVTFFTWLLFLISEAINKESIFDFAKHAVSRSLGVASILTLYFNLASFSLLIEVVLIMILLCSALVILTHKTPNGKSFIVPRVLAIMVILIFGINSFFAISSNTADVWFGIYSVFVDFLLSLLLSLAVYFITVFMQLHDLILILKILYSNRTIPINTLIKIAFLFGLRCKLKYIVNYKGLWRAENEMKSVKYVRTYMKNYRKSIRAMNNKAE